MSERPPRMDLEQLRTMLHIAPFHQWLGLDIAELTDDALILEMPWRDEIVDNPPVFENGDYLLPKGPGWGVEPNEAAMRRHPPKTYVVAQ